MSFPFCSGSVSSLQELARCSALNRAPHPRIPREDGFDETLGR